MQAASAGNIGLFEILLRLGADLSARADDGSTALHCAVKTGQIDMITFLLRHGAPIDASNQKARSPLHEAVMNRDEVASKLLMEHSASLSQEVADDIIKLGLNNTLQDALEIGGESLLDHMGWYIFKRATECDKASVFLSLAQMPLIDRKWIANHGSNALYVALLHGRLTIFESLMACNKLDPNMRVGRKSFLHIAAVREQTKILGLFLRCADCKVNATDGHGYTPLRRATAKGKTDTVRALLCHPQIRVNGSGDDQAEVRATALHLAAGSGHIEVAKLLLEHPDISFNSKDAHGHTPLQYALQSGEKAAAMVRLLLNYEQVQTDFLQNSEGALLSSAVDRGDRDMVRLLINHPRISSIDAHQTRSSLLQKAVWNLQWHIVGILLYGPNPMVPHERLDTEDGPIETRMTIERGMLEALLKEESSMIDRQDCQGQTMLHKVAEGPCSHLVPPLLQSGLISPNRTDAHGKTALYYAVSNRRLATVKLLLDDDRVDVNTLISEGQHGVTVLQVARRLEDTQLVDLLLSYGARDGCTTDLDNLEATTDIMWFEEDEIEPPQNEETPIIKLEELSDAASNAEGAADEKYGLDSSLEPFVFPEYR